MRPGGRPFVSVIVVSWNASALLDRCLTCLRDQDHESFEVIVVDDGSDDDTVEQAVEHLVDERFTVVRQLLNRGCPAARNLGLRYATGDIVAFIDADGFAHRGWLTGLVEAFADPTVGGAASVVFFDGDPLLLNGTGGTINQQWWAADLNALAPLPGAEMPNDILYPMGCGMAVRREALAAVGPFDDRMFNYYDDVDFGVRIWRAGWRIVVAKSARIDHGFGHSGGAPLRKVLLCEQNRMRVAFKHAAPGALVVWVLRELLATSRAASPRHEIKREALAWNLRHLPSLLRGRLALLGRPRPPRELFDPSPGERFVVEPPVGGRPSWDELGAAVVLDEDGSPGLAFGWHAPERESDYWFAWAGASSALVFDLDSPAEKLQLRLRQPPWALGPLRLELRSLEQPGRAWNFVLVPRGTEWRTQELPALLPDGRYVLLLSAPAAAPNEPNEARTIGVAIQSALVA